MKKMIMVVLLVALLFRLSSAEDVFESQMLKKSFLITKSTKSYTEAKKFALSLAKKSAIKLNFRELHPSTQIGLTHTAQTCQNNQYDFPCYLARGRYDDGVYISVEYSDAYSGFSEGYYIVVVASGEKVDKKLLNRVKKYVPDAYVKNTAVYMGCIH